MKDATKAVIAGRRPGQDRAASAPPPVTAPIHANTESQTLEHAAATLDGGFRARLCQSGLTAITGSLLSYLSAGDHLLMTDSCYGPTRAFCDGMLRRLGVHTTYYDPLIGAGVAELMRPTTRVVYVESPGNLTFEVQDVPAIAEVATARGAWTLMDNSWASPLLFKPFDHGVDVSIQAATKYIAGHVDLKLGAATATRSAYPKLERGWAELGLGAGEDDAALALRGMRSLAARLTQHAETGVKLAEWLFAQPEVLEVLHPALPWDPSHRLWKRDFKGASGLFGFVLAPGVSTDPHLAALLEPLELFGVGGGWGGAESRLVAVEPERLRTATVWPRTGRPAGRVMRIHAGLEDPDDLIEDLKAGFERLRSL